MTSKCMRFFTVFGSGTGTIHISGPGAGRVDDRHRPVVGARPAVLRRLDLVAAHVAERGAPPVGERLVVEGVEAEVLEPGGCVSHDAGG